MAAHAEDIQAHVRRYIVVGAALWVLTVVTVAISYLQLEIGPAVALALTVALAKGTLVALIFMHLIDERKAIYYVLALTIAFFAVLMWIPSGWTNGSVTVKSVWDELPVAAADAGHHGEGHGDEGGEGGGHH